MSAITVHYGSEVTTASPRTVAVRGATGNAVGQFAGIPYSAVWVPADQAYYWTEAWQDGELETLASLAMGGGRQFDSVDDLIAWLRSDDED